MKKLTTLIVLTLSSAAYASDSFVGTPSWQAPALTSTSASLLLPDTKKAALLKKACDAFESDMTMFAELPPATRREYIESTRSAPLSGLLAQTSFAFDFQVDLPANGSILSDEARASLQKSAMAQAADEERNDFTQTPDDERIDGTSLHAVNTPTTDNSLTAAARKLGLNPLPVRFHLNQGQVLLQVSGADLACDLLRNRASFNAAATGAVWINQAAQLGLIEYYQSLGKIVREVDLRYSNPRQRAAILGFRLGAFFAAQPGATPERAERSLLNAFDSYLDVATLSPNSLWTSDGQLPVDGVSKNFPVQISLSIKAN